MRAKIASYVPGTLQYYQNAIPPHYCFPTTSRVRETVIEVEYSLVESQLKELDEQLEKAIHHLNWTSEGMCMSMY